MILQHSLDASHVVGQRWLLGKGMAFACSCLPELWASGCKDAEKGLAGAAQTAEICDGQAGEQM